MNLHSLCKIDKSFKCVILKKSEFYDYGGIMLRYLWLALIVLLVLPACRSRSQDVPPEKLSLTLDVQEVSPETTPATLNHPKQNHIPRPRANSAVAPESRKPDEPRRKQSSDRRRLSSMPYSSGKMDSELNDIEQGYIDSIRQQHNQQVKDSERRVFGGFSPSNLFGK